MKEALKLALEALESVYQYGSDTLSGPVKGQSDDRKWQRDGVLEMTNRAYKPITAIKEALAQPEQEPVAWWNDTGTHIDLNVSGRGTPLYTTPPQPEERNFCPRCGKRTADLTVIHTCTPPQENT